MENKRKRFNSFVVKKGVAYLLLTKGKKTAIDLTDLEKALDRRWWTQGNETRSGSYYAYNTSAAIYLHCFLTGFKQRMNHIDGDGLNNRRANLREAPQSVILQRGRLRKNNRTGYRGVCVHGKTGKFRATISRDGTQVHLGCFDSSEEAAQVYDAASINYHGPLARLNFPLVCG